MGSWNPFQPVDESAVTKQHAADMAQAQAAIMLTTKISNYAAAVWHTDEAELAGIQKLPPEEINSAERDRLAAERIEAIRIVHEDAFNYNGKVAGWAIGIQTLRAIEARTPGTISSDRLAFPEMPQVLVDYAAAHDIKLP